ncbi:2Fe-2S ferredoxin [Morus notabilis]|uniref:2Fe-2S ferredoxin n=1 Tax=Morus notabilis TaxID=981085 RepID=W9RJZ2_9ROSA|nr:2Fe-2S ferredoxin [Morus notabilis]
MSKLSRVGFLLFKELSRGKSRAITGAGYTQRPFSQYLQTLQSEIKVSKGAIFQKYRHFSSAATKDSSEEGSEEEQEISVTFVDKDGEEKHVKVPIGMSMLEAAHENDIELEGKESMRRLTCLFNVSCNCDGMDVEYNNKLEDPTDEENDMLDLAFGLTETSRLGCQVIAKPELDGMRLAIPAATQNFAVDGYVPKPH